MTDKKEHIPDTAIAEYIKAETEYRICDSEIVFTSIVTAGMGLMGLSLLFGWAGDEVYQSLQHLPLIIAICGAVRFFHLRSKCDKAVQEQVKLREYYPGIDSRR